MRSFISCLVSPFLISPSVNIYCISRPSIIFFLALTSLVPVQFATDANDGFDRLRQALYIIIISCLSRRLLFVFVVCVPVRGWRVVVVIILLPPSHRPPRYSSHLLLPFRDTLSLEGLSVRPWVTHRKDRVRVSSSEFQFCLCPVNTLVLFLPSRVWISRLRRRSSRLIPYYYRCVCRIRGTKNSVGALISIDVNSFQRIRSWNIVDFNKRGVFSMQCWVRNAIHTFDHSLTVGQTRRKTVPSLQLHFLLFPSTLIIRNVI